MYTRESQVVPVTPIRKLLRRLPSLRRKRSSPRSSNPSITQNDVHPTPPSWSDLSPTRKRPLSNGTLTAQSSLASWRSIATDDRHPSLCSNAPTQLRRAQVAIQQYDGQHDAIVISTLPCYPFCCHKDLLSMSRPRLLQTAYLFNSCLPFCARFTDLEVSSEVHIRHRIEKLVGIVSKPPAGASDVGDNDIKAISDSLEQFELDMAITPPSSPLATYPSRRNMFSPARSLEVVVEEDESDEADFSSYRRTLKKRRVSGEAEPSRVSWDEL